MIGTSLAHYRITDRLGAGGMGEVYRATDTKLGRDVAIKVLPAELARDSERIARFEREARLLAALNHTSIAHVYGFESTPLETGATVHFLAMELVEGEDLSDRLQRGPVPIDEALEIARQITEALEEAHEHGIVHRDLKPGNVKLTPDGKVKVLDFGLAKAFTDDPAASSADASRSPTLSVQATRAGVILGTAAYMSPEQARGKAVDKRADVWAFGVVLYEMLTGKRLFAGETASDVLAAVLTREPDWAALPAATSPAIRRLLRVCLERNPKNRLHDIADARIAIEETMGSGAEALETRRPDAHGPRSRWAWWIATGSALLALVALAALFRTRSEPPGAATVTRTSILMPRSAGADQMPGTFALAPDGTAVVFVAPDASNKQRLFLRALDAPDAQPLDGTEDALFPFWSPDSRDIAFFAGGQLRRVPRAGGAVQVICDAQGRGGAWGSRGTIVFAPGAQSALAQVPASGGRPVPATALGKGDISHRFPTFLPDGRRFLFVSDSSESGTRMAIRVASLDALTSGRLLLEATSAPRFAPPGELVFQREGALLAQEIDPERLELVGEPRLLDDRPNLRSFKKGAPVADLASNGRMLYAPADARPTQFTWLDRRGAEVAAGPRAEGTFQEVALSRPGDRAAAFRREADGTASLWLFDLDRNTASRITPPKLLPWGVAWAVDGREVATWLSVPGDIGIDGSPSVISTTSNQVRRLLPPSQRWIIPTDVSTDGRTLLFQELVAGRGWDLGFLPLDRDSAETETYLSTTGNEWRGRLSPDGHHIAYVSSASGRQEVFFDSFPKATGAVRVPTVGEAQEVLFRGDGRELFIVADDGESYALFACDFRPGTEAPVGALHKLFSLPADLSAIAPAADGDRFLLLRPAGERWPSLTLVENWRAQLEARP